MMSFANNVCLAVVVAVAAILCQMVVVQGFSVTNTRSNPNCAPLFMSSFSADGSEYSSKDSDYDADDVEEQNWGENNSGFDDGEDDVETVEQKPVPMSKNAGNRFVALYWDHELEQNRLEGEPRESWWLHYDRDDLNEDHVMFCRKANLYNELSTKRVWWMS